MGDNGGMPVQIGGKTESGFEDPIGLLTDCHRRIERFLSVLGRLGVERKGARLLSEERKALDNALRYFRESAPKHTADEEESLFPRLRTAGGDEARKILKGVASLEHDHEVAERRHAELDKLGRRWLEAGELNEADAKRFADIGEQLHELYSEHIAREEGEVFPLASAVLDKNERQAMGREMARRRGLREPE